MGQIRTRVNLPRAERTKWVTAYQESGETIRTFCDRHGLIYGTFQNWLRRSREEGAESSTGFVSLQIADAPASTRIEIEYPTGVRVRLDGSVSAEFVSKLIQTVVC
jgi:transposase-like protein